MQWNICLKLCLTDLSFLIKLSLFVPKLYFQSVLRGRKGAWVESGFGENFIGGIFIFANNSGTNVLRNPPEADRQEFVNGSKLQYLSLIPNEVLGCHWPNHFSLEFCFRLKATQRLSTRQSPLTTVSDSKACPHLSHCEINDFLLLSLQLIFISFNVIVFGAPLFYNGIFRGTSCKVSLNFIKLLIVNLFNYKMAVAYYSI